MPASAPSPSIAPTLKRVLRPVLRPMIEPIRAALRWRPTPGPERSYAQAGEDLLLDYLLTRKLRIDRPRYLDIGAHHPTWLSNTYRFYRRGCRGVCVEPDPELFARLRRGRPGDVCLNACIATSPNAASEADFHLMAPATLNTMCREEVDKYVEHHGYRLRGTIRVPQRLINEVIEANFPAGPDLLSLDVEGVDLAILRTLDFTSPRHRPRAICVETLDVGADRVETKPRAISAFLLARGYRVYADTWINTIFVDQVSWQRAVAPGATGVGSGVEMMAA